MRKPYVRPMDGWWRRDPFFVRYMLREVTALAVAAYAIVLVVGVWRLAQGPAAFDGWVQALRSWPSIVFHLVLLAAMVIHAVSWFEIMPKTMPMMFVGGERVAAATITRAGLAAAVAAAVVLFALAWVLKP
ncbi:MAG TPA: fumarate reductase subunit C [Rhizobacter sp.]|nr:fumarate reductase subunit C [Rhizobacter sp.]